MLRQILLDVNAAKSSFMLFGCNNNNELLIDNIALKQTKIHKYLGLFIDNKLNWNEHIDQKSQEAIKKTMAIKRYLGLTWGIDNVKLMVFYRAVIVPTLTYACTVWFNATQIKRNIKF